LFSLKSLVLKSRPHFFYKILVTKNVFLLISPKGIIMQAYTIFTFTLFSLIIQAKKLNVQLQQAVLQGLVKVEAKSLGSYQEYCILMKIKNVCPDSLEIVVEAGRRLKCSDEKMQDILLVKQQIICLRKQEEKSFKVRGFCCQASKKCPKKDIPYQINTMADSSLTKLANFISTGNFDSHSVQQAVWAISDQKLTAQVASHSDTGAILLRQLVCRLKGEVLPWYTVFSKTQLYQSGTMENIPFQLRGQISFQNEREGFTTLSILNEVGMEVCQINQQWTKSGPGILDLNVLLRGLAKGRYIVQLLADKKLLTSKVFEI
jgi:hypothetical protein